MSRESSDEKRDKVSNLKQHLLNKLSDPSIVRRYEITYSSSSLHHNAIDDADDDNGCDNGDATNGDAINFRLDTFEAMEVTEMSPPRNENDDDTPVLRVPQPPPSRHRHQYPSWNYLTLRHDQNTSWAQAQFDKGVSYAKAALHQSTENHHALVRKAEVCYKEGLEMIPHHPQLLTAYGALCINDGRLEMAKELLEKAIQYSQDDQQEGSSDCINSTLKDARTYYTVVESKLHIHAQIQTQAKKPQVTLSNKAEQAMNDALAERAFITGSDPKPLSNTGAEYQLLSSDDEESKDKRRKHSHRKKKRRKREHKSGRHRKDKKRRRSERYDSSDDDSSISSDSSSEYERKRRRRQRRRSKRDKRTTSKRSRSRSRSLSSAGSSAG